jgi:hypothetical protein
MTHSLHRRGSPESLREDYVVIVRSAAGINRAGSGPSLQAIRNILCDVGISNLGKMETCQNMALGLTPEDIRADGSEVAIIGAAVPGRAKVKEAMRRLKEGDYGISITVSGLIDEVLPMCRDLGITPHTINLSLGVHGKTELLPAEQDLEITTMCGHALVAAHLVKQYRSDVQAGRVQPGTAARRMAEPCICGVFNMERATALLQGGEEPN